ncbi:MULTISPECIES: 1,4-dihydroxy-2-naphthoate polyprenyltransferase [unclassified Sporosarcina]|uniref:1,4-dihydroxy-2-naphthoate polyprenyltransferase n=1 Tax=unclassified Sporosarcina TaxID=2647733 RepID=UPI000C1687F1|nr:MULTISPECIES: 1,4-dihydroxy-2-naphthoate polyprenyltransferase [unclassified Sporosarcina]PIC97931.1 1,4-dihydroxy-2-naphthoate octaprenyltransferase [Sporosarcina sp. P29]PID03880.1 1,4-dihydroxy-2-naphthoate octaprenyltransferase [Sporosarcina sp. P30]PID07481.1 1,4-dihydroxy-2-naphthoate octaprenyltransferase [Sporosarcina sp. P31]PID10689.1 1,4-dihydroxy-2-naphthoate octaprenyltransferase [Sporosarcina sp. P32b]
MQHTIETDTGWRVWWQLTRPHTLTAAFAPVFLGTMIALQYGPLHFPLFLAMLVASLFLQMATNMFNEYYDFKRGLDDEHSIGIGGTIVRNGVQPKTVLNLALILYGLSVLLGIYICMETSWWLAAVGSVAMLIGYLYTGGPYPIAYTPFGELVSGFIMGMLLILIAFYIQTGTVTGNAILLSVPSMLLVGAIMLANNIRDIVQDTRGGRKTMAILVGRKNAVTILATFFIVSYAWIIALVVTGHVSTWALLVLLSIPKPLHATKTFRKYEQPIQVMPAMKDTGVTNTLFGLLLGIGILIAHFI